MKLVIVNADDFGVAAGITRGILEAHRSGIVSSTSMMVDMPGSAHAASLLGDHPRLGVGLHVTLTSEDGTPMVAFEDEAACAHEVARQLGRFQELTGAKPTHLDSHHNVHFDTRLLSTFREVAALEGIPLRGCSGIRYLPDFYGQWEGETHPEQVSEGSLLAMLATHAGEGILELGCHPGYVDTEFATSYAVERELELATLCSETLRADIGHLGIRLVSFREVKEVMSYGS